MSRIVFDLCGFSGAGLKITCGLRVMDSMTQLWCQKVGFSRFLASFYIILLVLPNVTDSGQNQQLFDFWSLTTFQSRQKYAVFGCPGVYLYTYIYNVCILYIYYVYLYLIYIYTYIMYVYIYIYVYLHTYAPTIPVVPHKAVTEVSKIGNYRRSELL